MCRTCSRGHTGSLHALSARREVGAYASNGRLIPAQRTQPGIPVCGDDLPSCLSRCSKGRFEGRHSDDSCPNGTPTSVQPGCMRLNRACDSNNGADCGYLERNKAGFIAGTELVRGALRVGCEGAQRVDRKGGERKMTEHSSSLWSRERELATPNAVVLNDDQRASESILFQLRENVEQDAIDEFDTG